jgi:nitrite reductase/ring-hydroxylating ferredoxin subunit/uncharacterized membrane protein
MGRARGRGYGPGVRPSLGRLGRALPRVRHSSAAATGPDDPGSPGGRAFRPLASFAERAERAPSLDGPVQALAGAVARLLPPGSRLDDLLHGVPFGQPAHPALVRFPLGCWTSAILLDFLPASPPRLTGCGRLLGPRQASCARLFGARRHPSLQRGGASAVLLAVGIATSLPSAASGLADWSALHRHQQRVGLAHAIAQGSATALFCASLLARLRGRPGSAKALSAAGLVTASAGAYLGGHLAHRLGAGASHAESIAHLAALGWQDLCPADGLPDGRPARRQLGYLSLLALRQGQQVHVLSDHCAHLGGPLHQGRLVTEQRATCIACPWHGSVFRVSDGGVVHGPATARQPSFEARITASGRVEIRPRRPARARPASS